MGYWSRFYRKFDGIFSVIPTVNPDRISWTMVILSFIYVYLHESVPASIILLFILLLFDTLDGVMARRIKKSDEIIDLSCDRISELVIFSVYPLFLLLVLVNLWLSFLKLKKNLNLPMVLPLRHLLLIYLIWGLV